jgi:hypothetical protein
MLVITWCTLSFLPYIFLTLIYLAVTYGDGFAGDLHLSN